MNLDLFGNGSHEGRTFKVVLDGPFSAPVRYSWMVQIHEEDSPLVDTEIFQTEAGMYECPQSARCTAYEAACRWVDENRETSRCS